MGLYPSTIKHMAKDRLASSIEQRFTFARDQQTALFEDFLRYKTLWNSKIPENADYPWDYKLFNPMVFATVRSFVSRITSGNVGVNLQAWNESERPKTRVNKALLEWEFQEVDLFLKVARWVYQTAMYGRGFVRTGWKYQKERRILEEDAKGNTKREILIAPRINRADLANVRVFDMFVANRNIPEFQQQPWVVHRYYTTIPKLIAENIARGGTEKDGPYRYLAELKKRDWFVTYAEYGADHQKADDSVGKNERWKTGVLEVLLLMDKETGKFREKIAGHDDFLIRDEDNPDYHGEYPFADLQFFPEDDEFWTPGVVQPIEDLQIGLNSTMNQYFTNASQQINNMWIQTGGKPIPEWDLISRPNGLIHGEVTPVKHGDVTGTSEVMMGRFEKMIQRTTGVTDQLTMGEAARGTRGAAFLQLEQQNIDENLKLFVNLLEQVGIKRIARHFLALNKQYITSEQIVTISGRHGYNHLEIKPDEVSAAFDPIIIPQSSLPKNPLIRAQNLMQLKELADREQRVKINAVPIWKETIDTMGMTDLDEIVPDDVGEAQEENDLLKKGTPVECQPSDNHDQHIKIHQYEILAGQLDQEALARYMEHIKAHKRWKLAADPELLERLAESKMPTPSNNVDGIPDPRQPQPQPQIDPLTGLPVGAQPPLPGGLPGNAPVDELGMIQQLPQGAPPTPPGMPPVIDPLLAQGGML